MSYEGNCRLGDLFTSRREKGRPGLPTLSVTLNDGLVNREDLERKQETSLAPEEHLLVKPGDIAYNMMRMWQGAFGLAASEGIVSPAYVVLEPKHNVSSRFIAHLLKSKRMRYLLAAYSYGITSDRLRLYFQDFARIPVTIPPKPTQERLAEILSTWDQAVSATERLLGVTERRNTAITKDLMLGRRRVSGDLSDWQKTLLGELVEVIVSSVDKEFADDEIPISLCNYTHVYYRRRLVAEMSFDSGTATASEISRFRLAQGDVVITKDSEQANDIGIASYVAEEIPNLVCGYHLAILRADPAKADGAYLSCLFAQHSVRKHFSVRANGVTRFGLPLKAIQDLVVVVPPLNEQKRISTVIFQLHKEHAHLKRVLENLIDERSAIAQRLLIQRASSGENNIGRGSVP